MCLDAILTFDAKKGYSSVCIKRRLSVKCHYIALRSNTVNLVKIEDEPVMPISPLLHDSLLRYRGSLTVHRRRRFIMAKRYDIGVCTQRNSGT